MEILVSILGIFLRLAVPIIVTVGIGWVLYKLDARWQAEARDVSPSASGRVLVRNSGCWKKHNCSQENRKSCPAYLNQDIPCWQAHRLPDGKLKDSCLLCNVFREAPVPVTQ